jgi:2-polyprenyl-6-methoxyphenol hydroxylase-like FAD-dependent oxidoreductase
MAQIKIGENVLTEPSRDVPIVHRTDVLVVGGGPAGVGAALAAARHGAATTIIEHYGFLGGMWTAGLLNPILDHEEKGGIVAELMQRLSAAGKLVSGGRANFDNEHLKYLLDRLMAESGVTMRLHRSAVGAVVDGNRVRGILTESKSGREALLADVVIDCTGDGDIAASAGVPFVKGREEDGEMQSVTLFFMLANVRYRQDHGGDDIYRLLEQAVRAHGLDYVIPYRTPSFFQLPLEGHAVVQIAHVHGVDGTDANELTRAEIEARAQIHEAIAVMQKVPELAGVALVSSGPHIGVRETRHMEGRVRLEETDLLEGRAFEDGICWTRFNIDIHGSPSKGTVVIEGRQVRPYQIPYRALLPVNREGLMMAGRCISGSSRAHASFRVTGDCVAMGQAAGTAAAMAVGEGLLPSEVAVEALVARLKEDGVKL